eukprot:jgi/Mesvir1/1859/Mv16417-RA.1
MKAICSFAGWMDVVDAIDRKGKTEYDFDKIFSAPDGRVPFRSSVDWPGTSYYKQMLKKYPNAKFILTVRDSADVWVSSFSETIGRIRGHYHWPLSLLDPPFLRMVHAIIWDKKDMFDRKFHEEPGPAFAKQLYLNRIKEVIATVPPNQLLIYNLKQGWKPLCDFLGVPVPDEPLPSINDRGEFHERFTQPTLEMIKKARLYVALLGVAAVCTGALVRAKVAHHL